MGVRFTCDGRSSRIEDERDQYARLPVHLSSRAIFKSIRARHCSILARQREVFSMQPADLNVETTTYIVPPLQKTDLSISSAQLNGCPHEPPTPEI